MRRLTLAARTLRLICLRARIAALQHITDHLDRYQELRRQ